MCINCTTGADPYCKVTCAGKSVISPMRKDTLDPDFDSRFVFYVKKPEDAIVKVQVINDKYMCNMHENIKSPFDVHYGELHVQLQAEYIFDLSCSISGL